MDTAEAAQIVAHNAEPIPTGHVKTRLERALERARRHAGSSAAELAASPTGTPGVHMSASVMPPAPMVPAGVYGLDERQSALVSFDALGMRPGDAARAAGLTFVESKATRAMPAYGLALRTLLASATADAQALAAATRAGRVGALSSRWEALRAVIEQRAMAADPRYLNPDRAFLSAAPPAGLGLDPDALFAQFPNLGEMYEPDNPACHMCDPESFLVPGASTGMMVRTEKIIGAGLASRNIVEWAVDTNLVAELRAIEKALAVETGQDKASDAATKVWVNIDLQRLGVAQPGA